MQRLQRVLEPTLHQRCMASQRREARDTIGGPEIRTLNIERPTSNAEVNACDFFTSTLEVGSWKLDVRRSYFLPFCPTDCVTYPAAR